MANYTHEQAQEAASRFVSLYQLQAIVTDTEFPPESKMENYSWFGIMVNGHCVCTVSSEDAFANLRKLAYIIAQTDQDLSQEDLDVAVYTEKVLQANNLT